MRKPPMTLVALAFLGLSLGACATERDDGFGDDGFWGSAETGGADTLDDGADDGDGRYDVADGAGDSGGDASNCMCAPKSDLIYLLAWDLLSPGELWTFDPRNKQFEKVASLSTCSNDMVFSMGVSRDARAWIQYQPSGTLRTIDVNTGECADPGYVPGQAGFGQFGMAFSSRSAADPCDKLYAVEASASELPVECPGQGCGSLGVINPSGAQLQMIGSIDYHGGELSGTGDGRLFAFLGVNPAKLVEFDKDSGEVINAASLGGLETTDAFAFAFWGGDFYFFTEANDTVQLYPEAPSKVWHLDFDNSDGNGQVLTTYVAAAPVLVAGAGVSTCAPFKPPA